MGNSMQNTGAIAGGIGSAAAVNPKNEHIIIEFLERHHLSLTTLEQHIENLEVKLESVTKLPGIRSNAVEKGPPPVVEGWNDESSKATRMIGEVVQRVNILSERLIVLMDNLET